MEKFNDKHIEEILKLKSCYSRFAINDMTSCNPCRGKEKALEISYSEREDFTVTIHIGKDKISEAIIQAEILIGEIEKEMLHQMQHPDPFKKLYAKIEYKNLFNNK